MISVKNFKFLQFDFSRANWSKRVFGEIVNRNIASLDYRNIKFMLKNFKFAFLEKELVHNFGQKFEIFFAVTFFSQIDRKKGLAIYFDRKRALFFGFFCKGAGPWFWWKIEGFFTLTFLG